VQVGWKMGEWVENGVSICSHKIVALLDLSKTYLKAGQIKKPKHDLRFWRLLELQVN